MNQPIKQPNIFQYWNVFNLTGTTAHRLGIAQRTYDLEDELEAAGQIAEKEQLIQRKKTAVKVSERTMIGLGCLPILLLVGNLIALLTHHPTWFLQPTFAFVALIYMGLVYGLSNWICDRLVAHAIAKAEKALSPT